MSSCLYVGKKHDGSYAIFRSIALPTEETHGASFLYAIGPFLTMRGAAYMAATCIAGMPLTIAEAEKQAL